MSGIHPEGALHARLNRSRGQLHGIAGDQLRNPVVVAGNPAALLLFSVKPGDHGIVVDENAFRERGEYARASPNPPPANVEGSSS